MGYSYTNGRLDCDACGQAGNGVRKRKCPYNYCPPPAICKDCWAKPEIRKGFADYHVTAKCKEHSDRYQGDNMKSFSAFTHVSGEIRFVGDCWEEGGFHTNETGEPITDSRGNTVSKFTTSAIDADDADLLQAAFAGDDNITSPKRFVEWLAGECGLDNATIVSVCSSLGLPASPLHGRW